MTHNVLVIGAAGFIGFHVTIHFRTAGQTVLSLDGLSGGFKQAA